MLLHPLFQRSLSHLLTLTSLFPSPSKPKRHPPSAPQVSFTFFLEAGASVQEPLDLSRLTLASRFPPLPCGLEILLKVVLGALPGAWLCARQEMPKL